jgi:hypothetical protein
MSRKNNKTIKKRYIEHIKQAEKVEEKKKEERMKNKEEKEAAEDA